MLILIGLGACAQAFASLQQLPLPSLTGGDSLALEDFKGKIVLLSFFEPQCSWCHRQMKVFNRVERDCSDTLQPLSVGINGNARRLKPELRRAKVSYPAVKGTPALLKLVGDVPATPWTLILGPGGELAGTWRGYLKYEQLQEIFPEFCPPAK